MPVVFSGFSEFGQELADFLGRDPSARGGVVSDTEGDAVDFAYCVDRLSELDVQLLGAQLEHAAKRITAWSATRKLGPCEILVEASHGRVCCAFVARAYVVGVMFDAAEDPSGAESERVLDSFRDLRRRIESLLAG